MPAMIRSEMPLPTPYSVICSPIHIRKIAPHVSVRIDQSAGRNPGSSNVSPLTIALSRW